MNGREWMNKVVWMGPHSSLFSMWIAFFLLMPTLPIRFRLSSCACGVFNYHPRDAVYIYVIGGCGEILVLDES